MKQITRLTLIIQGLLICLSISMAQDQASTTPNKNKDESRGIETIYDKSKSETSVILKPMTVSEIPGTVEAWFPAEGAYRKLPSLSVKLMAYFSFPGRTLNTPDRVVLGFLCLSQGEARFVNDRELIVVVDGARLNLGQMRVADTRVDSNIQLRDSLFYRETLELPVTYEAFVRIAKATKVTVHLGKVEFDLSAEHRASLGRFVNKMKS